MRIEYPSDWKTERLGSVVTPTADAHEVQDTEAYQMLGVRWYCDGSRLHDVLDGETLKTRSLNRVRAGQITYNKMWVRKGAFAIVAAEHDGLFATNEYPTFDAVPDRLNTEFFGYLMETEPFQAEASSLCKGTTSRARLNPTDFQRIRVALPPLPEQKKIAAILSSVDEAIQATQAVIEQTRRVKEGLLQDLLTRGIGHTRFKQTEIGEIPESWEVRKLESVLVDGPRNGMYKPADQIGSGHLIVGQTAFTKDRVVDFAATRRAECTSDELDTYGLEYGDVLVTRVYATPEGCGRPTFVGKVPEPAVYESNMMRLRADAALVDAYFLFAWLQKPLVRRFLMARASSSNQTSINQKTLGRIPFALPSLDEQRQISGVLRTSLEGIWDGERQLAALQQVKAGLLQDLLTGKVRVSV